MKKHPFSASQLARSLVSSLALIALFALARFPLGAEQFRFKFADGDSYRFNTITRENVYLNRELSHWAEISSRVIMDISDVKEATETTPASARNDLSMMMSERNTKHSFEWSNEYHSNFRRDEFGYFDISPDLFMPVTQNHPIFPDHDVQKGETWTAPGEEVYDLRDNFGIEEPFRVPFTATYTYMGKTQIEGKEYDLIHVEYMIIFDNPPPKKPRRMQMETRLIIR